MKYGYKMECEMKCNINYNTNHKIKERNPENVAKDKAENAAKNAIWNGSTTIEMALLMPLLIGVMLLVIYFSFFLYNRQAITTIAYSAAVRGAQMEQEGKNRIQQEITRYVEEESKRLLFVSQMKHSVKVTTGKVNVSIDLQQKTPFQPMLEQIGADEVFACSVEKSATRLHPVSVIWEFRRMVD